MYFVFSLHAEVRWRHNVRGRVNDSVAVYYVTLSQTNQERAR